MKIRYPVFIILGLMLLFVGCAAQTGIDPKTLTSPDEKALYGLMEQRCQALNAKDMGQFERIYVSDSPELEWIKNKGIPGWERYGVTFSISSLEKMSIVENVAAANFILNGFSQHGSVFIRIVEVLYEKQGLTWKIVAVGDR